MTLLAVRGTSGWTTCPESLHESGTARSQIHDLQITRPSPQPLHHHTTHATDFKKPKHTYLIFAFDCLHVLGQAIFSQQRLLLWHTKQPSSATIPYHHPWGGVIIISVASLCLYTCPSVTQKTLIQLYCQMSFPANGLLFYAASIAIALILVSRSVPRDSKVGTKVMTISPTSTDIYYYNYYTN